MRRDGARSRSASARAPHRPRQPRPFGLGRTGLRGVGARRRSFGKRRVGLRARCASLGVGDIGVCACGGSGGLALGAHSLLLRRGRHERGLGRLQLFGQLALIGLEEIRRLELCALGLGQAGVKVRDLVARRRLLCGELLRVPLGDGDDFALVLFALAGGGRRQRARRRVRTRNRVDEDSAAGARSACASRPRQRIGTITVDLDRRRGALRRPRVAGTVARCTGRTRDRADSAGHVRVRRGVAILRHGFSRRHGLRQRGILTRGRMFADTLNVSGPVPRRAQRLRVRRPTARVARLRRSESTRGDAHLLVALRRHPRVTLKDEPHSRAGVGCGGASSSKETDGEKPFVVGLLKPPACAGELSVLRATGASGARAGPGGPGVLVMFSVWANRPVPRSQNARRDRNLARGVAEVTGVA